RVADRADPHDAVPAFEMAGGIPGNGGDAVAELDAIALQHLGDFERAPVNFGVIGPDNRAFDRPGDDLLRALIRRPVLSDPVAEQSPILHQPEHSKLPSLRECYRLCLPALKAVGKAQILDLE